MLASHVLDECAVATLRGICARLIPPIDGIGSLDVAGTIAGTLTDGTGNGWRYDAMPSDIVAYQQGLEGVDQSACALFGAPFMQLEPVQQDAVLHVIQEGNPPGSVWQTLPAARFFEELLAAAVQACYAHPLVQESIGYVGMADAPGWQKVGLNQLAEREPRALHERHD